MKKYNAFTLWELRKKNSEKIKNKGIKATNNFHTHVDEKLKDIPLEKSLYATSNGSCCFIANVRLVIFIMINNEEVLEFEFKPASEDISAIIGDATEVMGDLIALGHRLAHGLEKDLCQLENVIKDLVKDEAVKKQIQTYVDSKTKLESHEPFKEFNKKLTEIINDFNWNQKFKAS